MATYVSLFLCSCLIALFFTPVLRRTAVRNGFLDYPDERKVHKSAVPRVGGIAITISFFISIILGYVFFRHRLGESVIYLTGLSIGGLIVVILGLFDDLWGLNAWKKIIGQAIAAMMLIPFGFIITELNFPFLGVVEMGWKFGIPFTLFWTVGIVNAMNFIDGIDGLAAGLAVVISSVLFVVAIVTGQLLMALVCLVLAGSTIGFLRYNFHPASIFMGDSGAMFLGFILAAASIKILLQNISITAGSVAPALIFGLPIVDTTWAIVRRAGRRIPPFRADELHVHHRLIALGLTQRQAVVILYVVGSLSSAAGLVIALTSSEKSAVVVSAAMLAIALIGAAVLGHVAPFEPAKTQTDTTWQNIPFD